MVLRSHQELPAPDKLHSRKIAALHSPGLLLVASHVWPAFKGACSNSGMCLRNRDEGDAGIITRAMKKSNAGAPHISY
jgi:hypothetical protein